MKYLLIRKYSNISIKIQLMYIANVADDYNDTLSINNNRTDNDNIIEIIIPLITIIPCGLSFICLISLMVYTLIKPLFKNK